MYEATFDEGAAETRPTDAGNRYYLTPMRAQAGRTFHPKIYFFGGERTATAYIGSANLTQQALTRNQEIMSVAHCTDSMLEQEDNQETMHDTTAVLTEIAEFLEALFESPLASRVGPVPRENAWETLEAMDWVREAAAESTSKRSRWFLHNLSNPLLEQVFEIIAAHEEEITAVDVTAPFYGTTVDVLQKFVNLGIDTTAWLQNQKTQVNETKLRQWCRQELAAVKTYSSSRYVHGKVIVLQTTGGTYVLGGSPNLSRAALLATATGGGEPGNVETAVLRRTNNDTHCLFDTEPFSEATPELTDFVPAREKPPSIHNEGTNSNQTDCPPAHLLAADLVIYESYDGGQLTVLAEVAASVDIDSCTLLPDTEDDLESTIQFQETDIEASSATTDDRQRLKIEKSLLTNSDLEPLRTGGTARLQYQNSVLSNPCWVNVHTPSRSGEAESAAEDRGATLVPMTLPELY
ncbi:phospholipase D-like domain-containing protein, partial [Natronococcus sp. A-GB7]|uniref:phospholipase D-like domain-containing protein n=1 Tax=Natronococcus sp. A-GB7 TaxID=3037649 RepID=UPI00242023C7